MSYVYMKVLETTPEEYQSGIARLTAGVISEIYEKILVHVKEGTQVVDLGCGPGTLAILCAKKGAHVIAIDSSEKMISHAKEICEKEGVSERVKLVLGDFTALQDHVGNVKVDLIVSTLALSEIRHLEQQLVFNQCWEILKEGGISAVADEVIPKGWGFKRFRYALKRSFYGLLTYWKTKKTTTAVERFLERMNSTGFDTHHSERFLGDTLELNVVTRNNEKPAPELLSDNKMRGLRGRLRGIFCTLRAGSKLIPIEPGLYTFGNPTRKSPVLVTANYQLTVGRVGHALRDQNTFLLVADTMGENVWCAARGDKFSPKEVAEVVRATRIDELVDHRRLILPQLAAGGIDHREIKQLTGWSARFGPVYAKDIPEYLKIGKKTEQQRKVSFRVKERFEMALQQSFFLSKMFILPLSLIGLLGLSLFPEAPIFHIAVLLLPMVWVSYIFFAFIFPLFPTNSFLRRGIMYGIFLAGFFSTIAGVTYGKLIPTGQWMTVSFALGIFLGMDYSGASPISKPTSIDNEYPNMLILLGVSIIIELVLTLVGVLLNV